MFIKMEKEIGNLGEYIYLIQTRESLRCNDNIYKIGKTKQPHMKRMESYPKGSKLFIYIIVNDSTSSENDLIKIFKSRFKKSDQGNEYFYGNPIEMVQIITQYQAEHYKLEENVNSQSVSQQQTTSQTIPQQQNIDSQPVSQTIPKQINQQTPSSQSVSQPVSQTVRQQTTSQTLPKTKPQIISQQTNSSQTTPQPVPQQINQQTSSSQSVSQSVPQPNVIPQQTKPQTTIQQNIALSRQMSTENIAEAEYIVQNYKTNDMRLKVKLIGSLKYIKNPANDFNKRLEILNKILSIKQYLTTNNTESEISNNVTNNNTNDKINANTNVNTNVNKVTVDNKNSVNSNVNKVTINDNTNVNSNDTNVNANNKNTNVTDVNTNTNTNTNTSNDLKSINLSRYKFLLEDLIIHKMKLKRNCSVNIYVKLCSEANVLEIKNIDVISVNRRDIQTLQMEELKMGKYENAYKIELNQYDAPKFNKIKKDTINDYIIKINSLHRQKFKNKPYFETTFLPDSK